MLEVIPQRHRVTMLVAIDSGMRWGELIGLRVRHVDFLRRTALVQDVVVEVSKKESPTGRTLRHQAIPEKPFQDRLPASVSMVVSA